MNLLCIFKCCDMCLMMTEINVLNFDLYISYCKCLHMSVLFQLQMSTPVGPVPTANVYTCRSCNCRKCLHMLVPFLRQMSACVGPVATAKVCLCWFCYYCKCLHVFFLYFLKYFFCSQG